MKNNTLSACGLLCDECEFYNHTCKGCYLVNGSTFWAKKMMPEGICPLFNCSINQKGFKSCGNCDELPCDTFRKMKDPNSTDKQHQESLLIRQQRLKEKENNN